MRDYSLELSPFIRERYHLIADASVVVADPVVRQFGTLVGSLCHNDPAGDWSVVAMASRAQMVVHGATGDRFVPIDNFLVDSFTTDIKEGEMATEVRFPVPPARTSGAYFKIERKVGDYATASAGVQVTLAADGTVEQAGVAIGAAGPQAMRVAAAEKLLTGQKPSADLIRAASEEAVKLADPNPDRRGSAEYKKAMAGVLVGRALKKTFERLGVGGLN
jgi:carbon-monoxide dehydrogenase medium subunit